MRKSSRHRIRLFAVAVMILGLVVVAGASGGRAASGISAEPATWPHGFWSMADWRHAPSGEQHAYLAGMVDGIRTAATFARFQVDIAQVNRCVEHTRLRRLTEAVANRAEAERPDATEPLLHLDVWDALVAACTGHER